MRNVVSEMSVTRRAPFVYFFVGTKVHPLIDVHFSTPRAFPCPRSTAGTL
jgi:hypothetical protein